MSKTCTFDGVTFEYHPAKRGPLIVLIHGFPDSPASWTCQIEHFKNNATLILPNLNSQHTRPSFRRVVAATLSMIKTVPHQRKRTIWLMAHDIGGPIALSVAMHLDRSALKGILLVNSSVLSVHSKKIVTSFRQALRSWYMPLMAVRPLCHLIVNCLPHFAFTEVLRRMGHPHPGTVSKQQLKLQTSYYQEALSDTWNDQTLRSPHVTVPLLAIHSINDPALLPLSRREWNRVSPLATVRHVRGGHWLHRIQPQIINRYFESFMAGVQSGNNLQ